ncbi:MAG: hypothetical protein IJB71_02970, partial [Bacilli bacterium]|nr:hypothetical protein [Bacilli bacterium]
YKFTNGLVGYRLVFENQTENLNTLMLITLENLNLTLVTLNAYQEEFEFLTDSAELIMNTLTFKKGYEYLTLDIKYPETTELKFESKGQENLIFSEQTKKYSAISNDYKYIVNIPSDYKPTDISNGNLKFISSDSKTNLAFEIRTSYFEYDSEYDWGKGIYDNYQVIYGYAKYNDKIYYVIKKQHSFLDKWTEEVEIANLISYDRYLMATIKSEKHIEDSEIEKFLKNITYEHDLEGQNVVNNNKIEGNLFIVDKTDSYSFDSLIGLDVLKVNYSFLNNQCRYSQSDNTAYRTFYCNDSSIEMDIIRNTSTFNMESIQKYEGYSNYKYILLETKKINGNEFKHYKETYTYTTSFYEYETEYHYFTLKLNENYNFLITIKGDLSNLNVDDFLDVEIEKYKYKVD